jgi:hypothetical protein
MKVVYRKAWGARPPKQVTRLAPASVLHLACHYSASGADEQDKHANCACRVRSIQNYHMDTQGWSDIAYNWLYCRHGAIFRGRGWGVRSAATGPANGYTVAACFLGNDDKGRADLTPEAKEALRSIFQFVKLHTPHDVDAKGHRDFMATSCPGDELYAFLKTLKGE